jgi:hypothetical protein
MQVASLFNCFERHLGNLEIVEETHDLFITQVLEDYIVNLCGAGFTMGDFAEDIYEELQTEVTEMLQKKIYGHYDLNAYREHLRQRLEAA